MVPYSSNRLNITGNHCAVDHWFNAEVDGFLFVWISVILPLSTCWSFRFWHSSLKTDFRHPLLWEKKTGHVFPHQEEICKKVLVAPSTWCSLYAPLRHLQSPGSSQEPAVDTQHAEEVVVLKDYLPQLQIQFYFINIIVYQYCGFSFFQCSFSKFSLSEVSRAPIQQLLKMICEKYISERDIYLFFYWFCLWR